LLASLDILTTQESISSAVTVIDIGELVAVHGVYIDWHNLLDISSVVKRRYLTFLCLIVNAKKWNDANKRL